MKSIFFRIYIGSLLAALAVGLAGYIILQVMNGSRLSNYLENVARGTFTLIAQGAQRHESREREAWLQAVGSLADLKFELINSVTGLPDSEQLRLSKGDVVVIPKVDHRAADVYVSLPAGDEQYLITRVVDINAQLARVTALLLLRELDRSADRDQRLIQLKKGFGYPVDRISKAEAKLSAAQLRSLKRGDVLVDISETAANQPAIQVFAPFGDGDDVLKLGPIPLFEWYPLEILLMVGVSILLALVAAAYLLMRPLQKRLARIAAAVSAMGDGDIEPDVPVEGDDALTSLARQINALANRVQGLLASQQELTRAVSHELRTPVSRLSFRLAMLEDEVGSHERFEGINKDLQDLNTLIDEIMVYATLEQGEPEMQMEYFDVSEMIKTIESEEYRADRRVQVSQQVLTNTTVYADRYYLKRALKNLFSNALRYAESEVSFVYMQNEGQYCIAVRDDGPGIPADQGRQVLKPFSKLDSSRSETSGNYGLGLSIADQIMSWHKGRVMINSNKDGGADFVLTWPKEQAVYAQ